MSNAKSFENIAKLIRKYRLTTDMSQTQLSQALSYKNGQFISNVERALCSLPLKTLKKTAEILKIPHNELKDALLQDYAIDIDNAMSSEVQSVNGFTE